MTTQRLVGEVAFITGGGRGLGQAITEALSDAGAAVAVAARSQGEIVKVATDLRGRGGSAIEVTCDVTDAASVEAAFSRAEQELGPISILVNNAGVQGPIGPIGHVDVADWWSAQTVHLLGALLSTTRALRSMEAANHGRIINIASQAGTFVAPNASAYAVAKASLIRLTEHIDAEHTRSAIRAFAIQPGTILTDMSNQTLGSPDAREHAAPLVALLESITPEDSATARKKLQDLVVDLASGRFDPLSGRYLERRIGNVNRWGFPWREICDSFSLEVDHGQST
ncbi:SDR family NAD(P)-dependent oxidoreductase, partial [Rhizorhapis suberifaciens]